MKNLLNNLLNWVLKKGSSETKKDQAWEEKEQAGSKKEQVKRTKLSEKDQVKGSKLVKRTKLEMNPCVRGSEAMSVKGSEAVSANHALITQLSRTNHPISLRAIRYAAVLFMVLMVGIGQAWGATETITVISNGISTSSGTIMGNKANSQTGSTLTGCTVSIGWTNNSASVSSTYYAQVQDNSSGVSAKYFRVSVNSGYKINSIKFYLSNTESSNADTDYGILAWDNDLTPALTNPSYAATGATFSTKKGTFSERTETFTSLSEVQISDVRIYRKISGVTYGSSDLTFGTKGKNLLVQKVDVTVEEIPAATKKIYLKNTMGWVNAYVTRLGTSAYWSSDLGSGSNGRYGTFAMTYDSAKKLFYYDAPADANDTYLCFTADNQQNYANFNGTQAVYVNGGYVYGKVVWVQTDNTFYKNNTKYYGYEDHTGIAHEAYSDDVFLSGTFNDWAKTSDSKFTESSGTYTKTIELAANTAYKFQIVDNAWFGNNGGVVQSQTNWDFYASNGNCNMISGPAGNYTFTYNRTTNKVSISYPDVEHPNAAYVYYDNSKTEWTNCQAHHFTGGSSMVSWNSCPAATAIDICGTEYFYSAFDKDSYSTIIFHNGSGTQTGDWSLNGNGGKKREKDDADWSAFATYTISFNGNGKTSGTMSSISSITANHSQTITSNTFEKSGYTFAGWKADVAVKINGSTVSAGTVIDDGATLQNICGNIALTAQWTCVNPTITTDLSESQVDKYVGDASPTLTVAATAAGGSVSYQWYSNTTKATAGATILTNCTTATYNPSTAAAGTTYYFCKITNSTAGCSNAVYSKIAKIVVSEAIYTVTYNVNGGGTVTPASVTQASSGASVTLATPSWSGYTIEGWYNNKTKLANAGASYTPTANITAYAHWTDNISGKVFSFIDNNYGDKFKAFDLSDWVTGDATGKSKTYTNGDGVQYSVSAGCWDSKSNAISSLAKFKNGTSSMSVVIPTGKKATVKISYGAYNADNKLTVNSTNQTAPSTALTDGMTNAQVFAALKEITLSNQTGTLTLGSSTGNIYIGRVSAVITGYTVTYAKGTAEGATGDSFTGTKTAGSSFTLSSSSSAFTRTGYVYDGWSVNANGSTKDYELGGSYTTDAPVTLYPHWEASCSPVTPPESLGVDSKTHNSATLSWDGGSAGANGYKIALVSATGAGTFDWRDEAAATYTATGLTPSTAYTFKVKYKGTGSQCEFSDEVTVGFTTNAAATYTVTYQYNGATGGSGTASETASSVTLPTPTKTNYTFQGWYESSGTKAGDGGAIYNPAADITLYALWRADCGGGGGSGATLFSQNFNSATEVAYAANTAVSITGSSSNNIFGSTAASQFTSFKGAQKSSAGIGINSSTGGGGGNYSGIFGAYVDNTGYKYCLAKTTNFAATPPTALKIVMKMTLKGMNGKNSAAVLGFAVGSGFEDSKAMDGHKTDSIHSGFSFDNHTTNHVITSYNSTTSISSTNKISDNSEVTLTWIINNTGADLTYDDPASGTTTVGNDKFDIWVGTTKYVAGQAALNGAKPLRHLIIGDPSGKKHEFKLNDITVTDLTPAGGSCYYVTYNGNGADGGFTKDETAYASGMDVTVLSNSFTKTGYTFTGWYTKATNDGTGTAYAAGDKIEDISANVTLYAQWTAGTKYSVTYNGNSATSGTAPTDASSPYASGSDVTVLGNTGSLTKTGYTFDGWNTANDGSGTSYAAAATIDDIAADVALYAKWKQTVTLNTGAQGSGADKTPTIYFNGASLSGFSAHTASGYELQGYYTASSGGTKVLDADGSFAASAVTNYITDSKWSRTNTTTLYAQWRASAGSTCYTWDATVTDAVSGTNQNFSGLYLTATSTTSHQLNSSSATAYTCYDVSKASKILTGNLNGTEIGSVKFKASSSDATNNTFIIAFSDQTTFSTDHILQVSSKDYVVKDVNKYDAAESEYTVTAPAGTKSFALGRNGSSPLTGDDLENSGSRYLYYIQACSAGGGTHTITYNNGGGSGSMSSHSSISDNGSQTLTSNTFTAPTNYTFAGWVADKDVTIGGDTKRAGTLIANGATITNITMDINLTAKWSLPLTLTTGAQGSDSDEELTVYYNSTSITGHTPHTAGGYRLLGYYTAESDGTKVLNADGTFAATAVTDYISDGKWTYTTASSLTLHGQWETSSLLKWNLQTNKSETSISTTSKESATVRISTENMTNLSNPGSLTITGSAKSGLTSKIATTAGTTGTDAGKYMSVQFQIANGYKLVPTAINVKAQPISHAQTVKLILEDNHSQSINHTSSSISKGSTQTVTMTNDGGTEFTGTVTLKIYCYGTAESDGYRLGSPIEINGSIEEACTMPSYTGLDYEQTEYMKGADASAITVTDPTDVTTYLWKQNTSNDRSGGSAATGTNNTASYTPSTSANGTTYYWCELTNACGTVKTPAVAISVRTDKTDPTVTWTNPAVTVNYGGGNYTLRATVNETAWDGTLTASMLTAPSGINIHDVTIGTDGSSKQYIEVNFDVQTSFDRATYATAIPFTLSLPETTNYDAVDDEHNVTYSACSGAGAGSSYDIKVRKDVTKVDNNYYCWLSTDGWISPSPNNSISTSSIKKADSSMGDSNQFDTIYDNNSQTIYVRTYHANINKVRIYAKFNANDMTVTNVYKHSTYFSPGSSNEIDADEYTVVYNDDENADDLGTAAQGYVDITLNTALAANDIICVKFNTSRVRPLGAIITEASGGSVSTTLTFASAGPIAKTVGDAAFSNVASTTSKSLGAITYSSSNTGVATVNATTGAVTIVGAGSTTITATLAASGCFQRTTTTYTLNVSAASCADVAGTVITRDLGCDGIELTVSGYTDGASVQWYKDEVSMGASYRNATCTVTVAGEYYAVTHKDCDKASNTVTIAAKTVTATKLVDSWYIKNGRLTPDIALVQTTGAESFTVTSGGSPITDIGGCEFYLGEDGIIYLKGAQEDGTAPSGMTVGDETITITASVCSTDATPLDIVIHRQVQTDKHVLAFVVTGTAKGGFTDGISADQTTNVPLYNTLTENFDVLATNIYSTDDEKKLKEYYSQFDILCVTDYPNTGTKGVNKKSYVDALGSLIDIRPILTMEAFVAKLSNWKAKGISGTPESPSERQYTMLLQCKDHEIFAGTTLTKIGEGDETMYRVTMVDNTMEEYVSLDVNTPGTKAYDAGGKPALQGFTFTTEMSNNDLLPLGLIDDGAGNDLQVGIERQAQMEARLMVLGINGYAMERLTDDGMQIIVNALKYLMKKNTEDIADCSTSFIGGDGDEPESTRYDWHDAAHWTGNALPQVSQKVRILTKCIIRSGKETPHVAGVIIAPRGKYNHGSNEAAGSLTIEPGAALIVEGKVEAATAPAYNKLYATTPEMLTINTNGSGQAALIFDNEEAETQATVKLYSLGRKEGGAYQFQYFASPMDYLPINPAFAGSGIYTYVWHENGGWERRGYYTELYAFEGVGITTKFDEASHNYTMKGTLASTAEKEITLTANDAGDNIIGNSWMAPINIASLRTGLVDDANIVDKTVYIYCTGNDGVSVHSGGTEEAGQWLAIPIDASGWDGWEGLKVIPAMQAFLIHANAETTLTLNYKDHVRSTALGKLNEPLRAPGRRTAHQHEFMGMRMRVTDSQTHTDLYLFEGEQFSEDYDNGWEAKFVSGDGRSAQFYAMNGDEKMAVLATDELEGTPVGFTPGKESNYTISFFGDENGYYLNDIKLQNSVRISQGETYTFTYEEGDAANRFYISRTAINAPEVATGMENLDVAVPRVQKIIYNDKLYIIRGGRLYDATGKVVK